MANPEQPIINNWVTANLALPEELKVIAESVTTVINPIITALGFANTLAQLIQPAATIDPIQVPIDLLLGQLEGYVEDLENLGFYIAGDFNLIRYPFEDLKGGYNAYERRMISRLLDSNDPGKPVFTENSTVLALFLYSSAPSIDLLEDAVKNILKFANLLSIKIPEVNLLPVPQSIVTEYSTDVGFGDITQVLRTKKLPEKLQISFSASSSSIQVPLSPIPLPAPDGFVVEISTVKDGIPIFYEQPQNDQPQNANGKPVTETRQLLDPEGNPFVLYGGVDRLEVPFSLDYLTNQDGDGDLLPEKKRVFAKINEVNIPISEINSGEIQKSFFVSTRDLLLRKLIEPNRDRFVLEIDLQNLPTPVVFEKDGVGVKKNVGEIGGTYYIRIRSVSSVIEAESDLYYQLGESDFLKPGQRVRARYGDTAKSINVNPQTDAGQPSPVVSFIVPHRNTIRYIESLTVALAILVLSRSDLPTLTGDQTTLNALPEAISEALSSGESETVVPNVANVATGLEEFVVIRNRILEGIPYKDFFNKESVSPVSFRQSVYEACRRVASEMYRKINPTPVLEGQIADSTSLLRSWRWTDSQNSELRQDSTIFPQQTILESLLSSEIEEGLALNPFSIGIAEENEPQLFFSNLIGSRTPGFLQTKKLTVHESLPSNPTQAQVDAILREKPHLAEIFDQSRFTNDDGSFSYRVPDLFTKPSENQQYFVGSADKSPVLYGDRTSLFSLDGGKILYCRNVIDTEVYEQARTILQLAASAESRPAQDSQWVSTQLLSSIPDLDDLIKVLRNSLNGLLRGFQTGSQAVGAYIDFINTRISELRNFLLRIESLIQTPFNFGLDSPIQVLPIVANGTQGVVNSLLNAQNKPGSIGTDYSTGLVILFGGAPAFAYTFVNQLVQEVE